MDQSGSTAVFRTLKIPNFRNYMAGNLVSQIGLWVQRIAVGWLTWELTKSPAWLGIMAMADFAPNMVMAPLAGAVADRMDRLKAIRLYVSISAVISSIIVWMTITETIDEYYLLYLVLANGIVLSFNYPARLSIVQSLVGREALTSAISISAIVFNIARIGGPAGAGWAISNWGVGPTLIFTVFADLVFVLALYKVQLISNATAKSKKIATSIGTDIKEGFQYAWNHPGIGPLLFILVMMAILGRPFIELLPGFAEDVFGRDVNAFAQLTAALGVGSFIGSYFLAKRNGVQGLTRLLIMNTAVLAFSAIGFAATNIYWVGLFFCVLVGFAIVFIGVTEQTLLQVAVDDSMRGRMLSFYTLIARGCPSAGALMMGGIAEFYGLQIPIICGALICVGVWIWARQREDSLAAELEVFPDEKTS
ncbi:MAG: hypothetical protein CMM52_04415 [Rhodospirillaceae bacterium]|nr:hypothetical protein [Rhodospirillaceae bacterium]|tara:strand:- start:61495 stop:62754 length:1260 start_codon:yes stop_codon:yes gene_type:complete